MLDGQNRELMEKMLAYMEKSGHSDESGAGSSVGRVVRTGKWFGNSVFLFAVRKFRSAELTPKPENKGASFSEGRKLNYPTSNRFPDSDTRSHNPS